jgi:hypothetical protein
MPSRPDLPPADRPPNPPLTAVKCPHDLISHLPTDHQTHLIVRPEVDAALEARFRIFPRELPKIGLVLREEEGQSGG